MKTKKTLGQLVYEKIGGRQLHGPWDKALSVIKDAYEQNAHMAVKLSHPSRVKRPSSVWKKRVFRGFLTPHADMPQYHVKNCETSIIFSDQKLYDEQRRCRITVEWQEPKKEKK